MSCSNNDTLAARFWAKVNKTDACWLWTGAKNRKGYGVINTTAGMSLAHRVSYELSGSPIPPAKHVLHQCDTPGCVNPEHLFLGTNLDNVRDRDSKQRGNQVHGTANGRAKVSDAAVKVIRCSPLSTRELATIFQIDITTVRQIINKETWKHV